MCIRYTQRHEVSKLEQELGLEVPDVLPVWNHCPGRAAMTVRKDVPPLCAIDGAFPGIRVDMLEWGYQETWMLAPDAKVKGPLPFAKAEIAAKVNSLSHKALRERRCIVIADGWFEWRREYRRGERKPMLVDPHFFRFQDDQVFGFGAIWARCEPYPGVETARDTVAILTTRANALAAEVYDRMPVILQRKDWDTWLSLETPGRSIFTMMEPARAEELEMWKVGHWMEEPKRNLADSIAPVGPVIRVPGRPSGFVGKDGFVEGARRR